MSNESFRPTGNTLLCSVTTSTSLGPTQVNPGNMPAIYVANPSTNSIFIGFSSSAAPTASVPTTSGAIGLCIPAGQGQVFNAGPTLNCWLSAVTSAGTASVYATAGTGQ